MFTELFLLLVKGILLITVLMVVANSVKAQTAAGDVFTTITYLPTTFGWVAPYWAKVADTANMLAGYMRVQRAQDSIVSIKNSVASKMDASSFTKAAMIGLGMMAYTDTAAMLSAYQTALNTKLSSISGSQVNTALGYTPYNGATNPNNYINIAGARSSVSLTTTGTSGAASYNSATGIFNIPQYANSGGTVTSVGLSSTDLTVSGSPVTGSGNITANLSATGVSAGTYDAVTVDAKGRVTAGFNWTVPVTTGARSFNTAYRESSTNRYRIWISAQTASALTLLAGTSGTITLQFSANGTSGWTNVQTLAGSNTGTLTAGLNTTQITGSGYYFEVPSTYYWQLATTAVSGTPANTFVPGVYSILQ